MTGSRRQVQGRQRDVLDTIATLENAGELITTARIAGELSLPRQNIRGYLLALRDRGLVHYAPTERHTAPIHLTDAGWQESGVARVHETANLSFPILGEVAAGEPTLADNRVESHAIRLQDVLPLHEGDFLLRIRGQSMTGIGIFPGDLVAIRPGVDEPLSGEITLVGLPGEDTATLKRWHRNNGTVTLTSENPECLPLTYPVAEVRVQGYLVGHIGAGRSRRTGHTES
ncbi:LexA family protein [Deinococcus radiopugnans]|uniref:LexA family protein n=1 Tax=Deinococcus radiopugnans TaxID=57497 RepID=UPI0006896241|nr:S24 family peptidase [Deinococcus radiopugnans]